MALVSLQQFQGKAILFATILASGMAFLDGSIVTIAAPVIQSKLQSTITDIQWIMNGYTLTLSSLLLVTGSLGDRFGRKKIFISGIILFVISSFLCSLSQTTNQLIISRLIEGIGGAMMVPGSLSIIDVSFDESVRGRVIGIWSGLAGGVAALGPFLGGWLVQLFGWQSIFYINLPLGVIALVTSYRYVPESKNHTVKRTDWFGAGTIFLSLVGITYGLMYAPSHGWIDIKVLLSLIGGLLFGIIFVIVQRHVDSPLIPFSIFSSPLVTGANIVTLFLYFALSGVIFFMVLNFQQLQHFSPVLSGLGLLPPILLITFLSGPAGGLADRIGPRLPMIIGPVLVAIGMGSFLLAGKNANYFLSFLPGLTLFGCGMSLVIAPLTKSALSVKKIFSGAASGVNNAVARVAGLFAIALLGAIVLSVFSSRLSVGLTSVALSPKERSIIIKQQDKMEGIIIPKQFSSVSRRRSENAIDDAFLYGFRYAIGISAVLALLGGVLSYIMIRPE